MVYKSQGICYGDLGFFIGGIMLVKPMNKRILLEQVQLEEKETNLGFFQLDDKPRARGDFYKVLDKSDDCVIMVEKGDLISAEVVTPLGKVDNKIYFVCHENSIVACLKE